MPRPLATALLLLATMLWGFAFVAQKHAMDSMGPLTFTAARYLLGGVLVLPLVWWERNRVNRPLSRAHLGAALALSIVFFMGTWLQQWGLATTTVTNGGFLTGLYVMFVPLIAFIVLIKTNFLGGMVDLSVTQGLLIFVGCLPIAFVGFFSALYQARVAASAINMTGARPELSGRGVTMAVMVETYAVLALLSSFLMVFFVQI